MSIGYLSLNGFANVLENFALYDPNINSFGFGQLYNSNGQAQANQEYPGMWCNPVNSVPSEYAIRRTFQILIYDVPFVDGTNSTNVNKIVSDCEELAFRFIRFLKLKSDIFDLQEDPTITPFTDKFLDDVCGVIIDISIQFNGESSDCEDPSYNFQIKQNDI